MAVLASNNGGTLTIPDGDYVVTSYIAIPSGVTIQGSNGLQSMAPTSDVARKNPTRITLRGSNRAMFRIGECVEGVTIRDIELYAESNQNTSGVEALGAYNTSQGFLFERVSFNNFNRGINAYALPQANLNWQFDYVKVVGCRFILNRDTGIFINSRNTDWKIESSLFVSPRRGPGQNANGIHLERSGMITIIDTFAGGFPGNLGGTFINILDAGPMQLIGTQCESMTNSIVYNEVKHPEAGDYSILIGPSALQRRASPPEAGKPSHSSPPQYLGRWPRLPSLGPLTLQKSASCINSGKEPDMPPLPPHSKAQP
jgi:hypothetical protein